MDVFFIVVIFWIEISKDDEVLFFVYILINVFYGLMIVFEFYKCFFLE